MRRAFPVPGLAVVVLLAACSSSSSPPSGGEGDAGTDATTLTWKCETKIGYSKPYDKRYDCEGAREGDVGCQTSEPRGTCHESDTASICGDCTTPPGGAGFAYTVRSCTCSAP